MTRYLNALLIFLMVLSAAAVYDMKYEAKQEGDMAARLERRIAAEQEAISALKAEWATLTQPARLAEIVRRHADIFKLQPMTGDQMGTLADIPPKPVVVPSEGMDSNGVGEAAALMGVLPEDPQVDDDGLVR
jgi:hypothetical protein